MDATSLKERNCALQGMIGAMALAEASFGLLLINDGASLPLLFVGIAGCLSMALGTIIHYCSACRHFVQAKGYGEGWAVLALFLAFATAISIPISTPKFIFEPVVLTSVSPVLIQAYPLMCLGVGAIPILLLPDRSRLLRVS